MTMTGITNIHDAAIPFLVSQFLYRHYEALEKPYLLLGISNEPKGEEKEEYIEWLEEMVIWAQKPDNVWIEYWAQEKDIHISRIRERFHTKAKTKLKKLKVGE